MKELLNEARHEILELRRANEIFAAALGLKHAGRPMRPDVASALQNTIESIERENQAAPTTPRVLVEEIRDLLRGRTLSHATADEIVQEVKRATHGWQEANYNARSSD